MLTRNTKLYKITTTIDNKQIDIHYKDLTANQLNIINNIKNIIARKELAAEWAICNIDSSIVPYSIKIQIGEDIISRSEHLALDVHALENYIKEYRSRIKDEDPVLMWISNIIKFFPGTSIVELLNLTYKDLVELVVLAEAMSGIPIFGAKKKGMSLVNPSTLPDGGKALKNQIRDLNNLIKK